jgi:hypothetical protein
MELKLDTDKMIARIEDGIGWMIFNQPEKPWRNSRATTTYVSW